MRQLPPSMAEIAWYAIEQVDHRNAPPVQIVQRRGR
jgi:hypothetical protein